MEDLGWCALQFLIEARKYLKIRDWDKYQIPEGTTYRVHILPRHWNVLRGWTQWIGYPPSALVEIHPVHWWISTANWALNWSTPTTLQSYALEFFFTVIFPVFFMSWLSYIPARSTYFVLDKNNSLTWQHSSPTIFFKPSLFLTRRRGLFSHEVICDLLCPVVNFSFVRQPSSWWPFHTWYLSRAYERGSCKFFLAGVNFYRFNAKNWHFRQILREKWRFYRFNAKNWRFSV